jgi:hypothetical protein
MLRAQESYDSLQKPQRIAEPQNVEGNLRIASVQNVQTVQVVKTKVSDLKSLSIQRPRRFENLIVPREIEG